MKRFLLNFLILNLVMAAVGWVVTDRCLHFLTITVDAKAPVTIKPSTEYGSFGFSGKGLETLTEVQPTNTKDLSLRFVGSAAESKLIEVRFSEHVVLNRCWTGAALQANEKGEVVLDPAAAHWGVCPYFFAAFGALEVLLLILCWLVTWLTRKDAAARWTDALIVSGVLSVFVCLVVPLQTFLGNSDCFGFSFGELVLDLLPRAGMVAAVAFALLWLGGKFAGRFWLAVVVAFVAYEYLETGILSIGNPTLDGDAIVYKGLVRGAWDAAVLVVLSAALFLARNTKAPVWTALAVLVLSLCSLLDSRKEKESSFKSDLVDHPTPNAEVIKSTVFSAKKNVMLIFLDCISTTHVLDVLSQSEELRNAFDGFTFCTNNVGMYHNTINSISAVMTGRYHGIDSPDADLVAEVFSSASLLKTYLEKGAKITFQPGCTSYGFTTQAPVAAGEVKDANPCESPIYRRMVDQQQWNVYEIAKFRMTPYALKYYVYSLAVYGWGVSELGCDEAVVFPVVAEAKEKQDCELAFLSYHTLGAHPPYGTNRDGEYDPKLRIGYLAKFEKTWYSLRRTADLFHRMKERGLYDKTFVILLADHGGEPFVDDGITRPTDAPARAFPFLMFKPIGERGALVESACPTSHAKVNALVRSLAANELSKDETLSVLCSSNRVYRGPNGNVWIEYQFGPECYGKFSKKSLCEAKSSKPMILGYEYSFAKDPPPMDIDYLGEEGMAYENVRLTLPPAVWRMRAPAPETDYQIEVNFWMTASKVTGSGNFCKAKMSSFQPEQTVETEVPIGLREMRRLRICARSDAHGEIRISFVSTGEYGLQTIRVSRAEK